MCSSPKKLLAAWRSEVPHDIEGVANEGELLRHPAVDQLAAAGKPRPLVQASEVDAHTNGEFSKKFSM